MYIPPWGCLSEQANCRRKQGNCSKISRVGLQLNNFNDYFYFDKNITAKVEYSKTIATDKIEILSDVRLNKHHLMLMLNMGF